MSVVPPRQAAFLSVANLDETGAHEDKALATEIMNYLRAFAVSHGVNAGHIRQMDERTLLLRLDELPREAFLQAILGMTEDSRNLKTPGNEQVPLKIRVGAMSERAMRSFVNDAAQDMLAYMNHADCASAFLTGDEIDIWRKFESSNIEFISHEQLKYLDPFSGLIKESRFFTLLQHILDDFEHCDPKARVLFFDIEDFKSYNRTFGLERGDELLLHVARTIKGQFPTDVVAHLSIDRFAVVTNSPDVMRKCAIIHEDTKAYHKSFAPEIKCGIFKVDPLVTSAH
ncbi:MAG: GGDEF domain-containing protein, partial [Atopobiaceae bacterium]|nr:GGDEF domain-containing protein [Atopobiaceae bacterium]